MDKPAKISKRQLDAEIGEAFAKMTSAIASFDDAETVARLLRELFSPNEIRDVALRWRLLELLRCGMPQRAIAERLGISLCKITRGSRILKTRGSVARDLIETQKEV